MKYVECEIKYYQTFVWIKKYFYIVSLNHMYSISNNIDYEMIDIFKIKKEKYYFNRWTEKLEFDTYGNKPIVEYNNKPTFAELAVVEKISRDGVNAVWVDNFRRKFRNKLPNEHQEIILPEQIKEQIDLIVQQNKSMSGCWDIISWNERFEIKFYELKLKAKDKIRNTQINFLQSAIAVGLKTSCFTIIEWEFIE